MTPVRELFLSLLWLTTMLVVCRCSLDIGIELASRDPSWCFVALLGGASALTLVLATAMTTPSDRSLL